jgi:hypothetical protein
MLFFYIEGGGSERLAVLYVKANIESVVVKDLNVSGYILDNEIIFFFPFSERRYRNVSDRLGSESLYLQ